MGLIGAMDNYGPNIIKLYGIICLFMKLNCVIFYLNKEIFYLDNEQLWTDGHQISSFGGLGEIMDQIFSMYFAHMVDMDNQTAGRTSPN